MDPGEGTGSTAATRASMGSALWAGAVGSGVIDLVELLLPLWAGAGLALTGTGAGVLAATVPLGSLVGRPLAGSLVDAGHRASPLLGGLVVSAAGALLLAAASSSVLAGIGALLVGAGVGLVFIVTMALVADAGAMSPSSARPSAGSSAAAGRSEGGFADLFAWESRGTLIALVAGVSLASAVGYRSTFAAMGAVCLATCALVVARRDRGAATVALSSGAGGSQGPRAGRGVGLAVVWLTASAQHMVMLVAMLRLQRHEGLDLQLVSLLMLPGLLVFAMAGSLFTGLTRGRRPEQVLPMCYLAVAVGALVMAVLPTELGIAVGWCLAAAGIAVAVPQQRSAVASCDQPLGRALGRYGMTVLAGSSVGAVIAGYTYTHLPWPVVAGGVTAALLAAAAASVTRRRTVD